MTVPVSFPDPNPRECGCGVPIVTGDTTVPGKTVEVHSGTWQKECTERKV